MELKQSARWTFAKPMMKKLGSPLWKISQAGMPVWWLSFLHKKTAQRGNSDRKNLIRSTVNRRSKKIGLVIKNNAL
jgi:hypothetical protein